MPNIVIDRATGEEFDEDEAPPEDDVTPDAAPSSDKPAPKEDDTD